MFPRRTYALVDSALLFIRSAPVSIGAGLLAFSLTPIARRYLCRRQATSGDMERSDTHTKLFRLTRRARSG